LGVIVRPKCGQRGPVTTPARSSLTCQDAIDIHRGHCSSGDHQGDSVCDWSLGKVDDHDRVAVLAERGGGRLATVVVACDCLYRYARLPDRDFHPRRKGMAARSTGGRLPCVAHVAVGRNFSLVLSGPIQGRTPSAAASITAAARSWQADRRTGLIPRHSSPRAAIIYQHATQDRDKTIADGLGQLLGDALAPKGHPE
jgi:hypothetical protein